MYFLNIENRDHQKLFGSDAFYDLNTDGSQAKLATKLRPGDLCIVVSYVGKKRSEVSFVKYKYSGERFTIDPSGIPVRVLCGEYQESEYHLKIDAFNNIKFNHLFNKLGQFKQKSVSTLL